MPLDILHDELHDELPDEQHGPSAPAAADEGASDAPSPELLVALNRPCPRYTSYPTADRFSSSFGQGEYEVALRRSDPTAPLSLYVHLPFCPSLCTYCGCTVVVSKSPEKKARYLDRVLAEIDRVADLLDAAHAGRRRRAAEIHLGGGTPNTLSAEQLAALLEKLEERFEVAPDAACAIEIDPRRHEAGYIQELADMGFNRISMGVQDFDGAVQHAIGRLQTVGQTEAALNEARRAGFSSVNVDLIYGLPRQTEAGFLATLDEVVALSPDRIALFSFAYVPEVRPPMRRIPPTSLPGPVEKMSLFLAARRRLEDAGYVAIGMDHFARPSDPLARAAHGDTAVPPLARSFQGYTLLAGSELLGFGMSAIGFVGGAYVANPRRLDDYQNAIDAGALATERGHHRSADDEVRAFIIEELMCRFRIDDDSLARRFPGLTLRGAFGPELSRTRALSEDGLCTVDEDGAVRVTPLGRFFVRNVASCFDRYFGESGGAGHYSKAV